MTRQRKIDPEIPPTRAEDWVGATISPSGLRPPPAIEGGMLFHLYRSSRDRSLFVATDGRDPQELLPCPDGGEWVLLKRFPETGRRRVAFSEADAKKDIQQHGYHLTRAGIRAA
jgi:hypothetical protein